MRLLDMVLIATFTIAFASLIAGCGGEAAKSLRTFKGPGYSVLMPGKPDRSVSTVKTGGGPVKVVAYVIELRTARSPSPPSPCRSG